MPPSETIRSLLDGARRRLTGQIPEPVTLDAEYLLAHTLGCDRSDLVLRGDDPVDPAAAESFRALVESRRAGRSVAHLLGEWEFYGVAIFVSEDVLVPRPETELLVEGVLEHVGPDARVADLGTGSGCLAVALAVERPDLRVEAYEISGKARAVAARNIRRHGLEERVSLVIGDYTLGLGLARTYDAIVANPPYIAPDDPSLAPDVARFEPRIALIDDLDGDGLGHYRRIASLGPEVLAPGGQLFLEVGDGQAAEVAELFREWGEVEVTPDLAGIDRRVHVRRGSD